MELTYNTMKEWITNYFDCLPSIVRENNRSSLAEFYTPNFKIHRGSDPPIVETRDEWIIYLCDHLDSYRTKISYEPEPLGIFIDEQTGWASAKVMMELKDPDLKQYAKNKQYFWVVFKLCAVGNSLKAERKLIVQVEGFE